MNKKFLLIILFFITSLPTSTIALADNNLYYPPPALSCSPGPNFILVCKGYDAAYLQQIYEQKGICDETYYFDSAKTLDSEGKEFEYIYLSQRGTKVSLIKTYWTIVAALDKGSWDPHQGRYICKAGNMYCPFTSTPYVD